MSATPLNVSFDEDNDHRSSPIPKRKRAPATGIRAVWLWFKRHSSSVISLISIILNVVLLAVVIPDLRVQTAELQAQEKELSSSFTTILGQVGSVTELQTKISALNQTVLGIQSTITALSATAVSLNTTVVQAVATANATLTEVTRDIQAANVTSRLTTMEDDIRGFVVGQAKWTGSRRLVGNITFQTLPNSTISFILPRQALVTISGSAYVTTDPDQAASLPSVVFAVFPDAATPRFVPNRQYFPSQTNATTHAFELQAHTYELPVYSTVTVCLAAGLHTGSASMAYIGPPPDILVYEFAINAIIHPGRC